jgi:hypothetical protein
MKLTNSFCGCFMDPGIEISPVPLSSSKFEDRKKSPQAVGQIQEAKKTSFQHLITELPWGHNILLVEKIKDRQKREWYMNQCLQHGWSRNILDIHIKNRSYEREGKVIFCLAPLFFHLAIFITQALFSLSIYFQSRPASGRLLYCLIVLTVFLPESFVLSVRNYNFPGLKVQQAVPVWQNL